MKKILLILTVIMLMTTQAFADQSGKCGKNATWTLNETTGVLTISGTGMMTDYSYESPFYSLSSIKQVVIQEGITSIGDWAFYRCSGLTEINIPNSVTSIGKYAFYYCSGLTSINIPNSVTSIGDYAFRNCSGLTAINIPNSVTSIGNYAFSECSGMTSLNIPNSVTSIGYCAFYDCYLQKSNVTNNSAQELSGITYIDERTQDGLCIKDNVYINGEFKNNVVVKCFPTSTTVNIPNSVTSIVDYAFYGCSGLTSINIPNSVTSIEKYAFYYCSGLTSIKVESGNTKYDSRDNCNAIIETETNALILGCENTTIPNSVTSIGNYAFSGCSGLTAMNIPNSVTSIGYYAFSGCGGLTEINIPNSVTSIGDYAFSRCGALKIVYMSSAQPPTCGSYTFDGVDKNTCTLYVPEKPATALLKYCGTAPWNTFVNIETFNPEGSEEDALKKKLDVNDDGVVNSTDIVRLYNYIITGK